MGVGAVPSSFEMYLGPLGLHGRMSALSATVEADLIISVGSRFSDRTYSAHDRMESDRARVIHIDLDPTEFGKHGHPCVNLQADASKALSRLMCALGSNVPSLPAWKEKAMSFKKRCCCDMEREDVPIAPQRVMCELNKVIDDDTIVTTDVGQNQMWAMHYLNIEHPRQFITSGTFGTMGFGLPSAIGAKAAKPDKDVITVTGDGGLQMVIQELSTSVAENFPVTVVLLNNGTLGMVRQMQKHYWNKRYSGVDLGPDPDFVTVAKGFGAKGIRVEKPGEIGEAIREAKESDRTTVVEIMVDPEIDIVPMLPANPKVPIVRGGCRF
jgi:acetolactate synthase-1/2/3 large subunit